MPSTASESISPEDLRAKNKYQGKNLVRALAKERKQKSFRLVSLPMDFCFQYTIIGNLFQIISVWLKFSTL